MLIQRTHQGNALILNVSILKGNRRKTRDLFQCLQCGLTAMADYIGAIINIRLKAKLMMAATVNQPIVGETLISTYKPPIKIGGS